MAARHCELSSHTGPAASQQQKKPLGSACSFPNADLRPVFSHSSSTTAPVSKDETLLIYICNPHLKGMCSYTESNNNETHVKNRFGFRLHLLFK